MEWVGRSRVVRGAARPSGGSKPEVRRRQRTGGLLPLVLFVVIVDQISQEFILEVNMKIAPQEECYYGELFVL